MEAAEVHGITTRRQALAAGISRAGIEHRLGPHGGWTWALRGVYATQTGPMTQSQRWAAALAYAGPHALLGGPTAAELHGLRSAPRTRTVHVLLPHRVRRTSHQFVKIRRSAYLPEAWSAAEWRAVPVARAVIDTCLELPGLDDVRALMAESVQRRRTSIDALAGELALAPTRGSAHARRVLEEVADGVRSASEGTAREIVLRGPLPPPIWNADLFTDEGEWLCCADAWFAEAGMAFEIDGQEWHFTPAGWHRTMDRHARMTSWGIRVVHAAPSRLDRDPEGLSAELVRCHAVGVAGGGAPRVSLQPPPGWARW